MLPCDIAAQVKEAKEVRSLRSLSRVMPVNNGCRNESLNDGLKRINSNPLSMDCVGWSIAYSISFFFDFNRHRSIRRAFHGPAVNREGSINIGARKGSPRVCKWPLDGVIRLVAGSIGLSSNRSISSHLWSDG